MIRIRLYQCLDADAPEASRYLAVASVAGAAVNCPGASALEARGRAEDFVKEQRERAERDRLARAGRGGRRTARAEA